MNGCQEPDDILPHSDLEGVHFRELYAGRQLKLEGAYDKNGMYYGTHRFWNETGLVEFEAAFKEGVQISASRLFPNGRPEWKKTFKNGYFHGIHRVWHPTGQLIEALSWHEGRLNGRCRRWYVDGQLKSEQIYNKGKLEYLREWDNRGVLTVQRG